VRCPQCGEESPEGWTLCLGCGQSAGAPKRSPRRVEISEIDGKEQGKLLGALRTLDASPSTLLHLIVEQGFFELQVITTDAEQHRLERLLTALGVKFQTTSAVSGERFDLHLGLDALLAVKLLAVAGVIAASQLFGVPLLTQLGALTFVILLLRTLRIIPRALSCPAAATGRWLGSVNEAFLAQLTSAMTAQPPQEREQLRPALRHFAGIVAMLRADGALLVRPELASIDLNLHELMSQLLRAISSGDDASSTRDSKKIDTQPLLTTVEQRLQTFLARLRESGGVRLKASPGAAPLSLLAELQEGIDRLVTMTMAPSAHSSPQTPLPGPSRSSP